VKAGLGSRGLLLGLLVLAGGGVALWVRTRPHFGPLRATPVDRRLSVEVGEAVHFTATVPGAVEFTWSIWGSAVSHLPTWTYVALPEDAGWQQVSLVVRGTTGNTLVRSWDVGVVPPVPPALDLSPPPGRVVVPAGGRATFRCGARVPAARPSDRVWFEWTVDGRTMSRQEQSAAEAVSDFLLPVFQPGSHRVVVRVNENERSSSLAEWVLESSGSPEPAASPAPPARVVEARREQPAGPAAPVVEAQPAAPAEPAAPVIEAQPPAPAEPAAPVVEAQPTAPAEPAAPVIEAQPPAPAEPAAPVIEAQPPAPAEPAAPVIEAQPPAPAERAAPVIEAQPAAPAERAAPVVEAQPPAPAERAAPVIEAQPPAPPERPAPVVEVQPTPPATAPAEVVARATPSEVPVAPTMPIPERRPVPAEAPTPITLPRAVRLPAPTRVTGAVGERIRFATGIVSSGSDASYDWSVDGRRVQRGPSPSFEYVPETPGSHRVAVALHARGAPLREDSWRVTAREPRPVHAEAPATTRKEPPPLTEPPRVASVPATTLPRVPPPTVPRTEERATPPVEVARTTRPGASLSEDEVHRWLDEYAHAWSRHDVGTLQRMGQVRSQADAERLLRYFGTVEDLRVDVRVRAVRVEGERAAVEFDRVDTMTDPSGRRQELRLPPQHKEIERTPDGLRFVN